MQLAGSSHFFGYMDVPRNLAAAGTGVATGLLGGVVPVIGAFGGVVLQLLENDVPTLKRGQYITEGVVDGSVALLAFTLVNGSTRRARAQSTARPQQLTDADALIG